MTTVYRTVNTSFWTDPKIRSLGHEGKLLMLYLVTCPHTNVAGIYYVPEIVVMHETGLKKTALDTLWDRVSRLGLARRDHENEVVWVVNMMKYQGRGGKVYAAAANALLNLHNSPLVKEFLQRYPNVEPIYADKVSHRVSMGHLDQSDFGNPDMDSDMDSDKESDDPPSGVTDQCLLDWIAWWNDLKRDGVVSAGVSNNPPSEAVQAGWKRVCKSHELQAMLANREAIESEIRQSKFLGEGWFTLEKLLGGKNRDKAYFVQRILDGGYRDSRPAAKPPEHVCAPPTDEELENWNPWA